MESYVCMYSDCVHVYYYVQNFGIGIKNEFIKVTFEKNFATATCKFLQWQPPSKERYQSNCSIVYGYISRFPVGSESALGLSLSNTVVLNLSHASDVQFKQEYQFIVTASNGSFTVQVVGIFSKFNTALVCNQHLVTQLAISLLISLAVYTNYYYRHFWIKLLFCQWPHIWNFHRNSVCCHPLNHYLFSDSNRCSISTKEC